MDTPIGADLKSAATANSTAVHAKTIRVKIVVAVENLCAPSEISSNLLIAIRLNPRGAGALFHGMIHSVSGSAQGAKKSLGASIARR